MPDQLANACFLTARTASRLSPVTWQGHTHPNVCTTSIDGSEGFVKIHVQRLLSPCVDVHICWVYASKMSNSSEQKHQMQGKYNHSAVMNPLERMKQGLCEAHRRLSNRFSTTKGHRCISIANLRWPQPCLPFSLFHKTLNQVTCEAWYLKEFSYADIKDLPFFFLFFQFSNMGRAHGNLVLRIQKPCKLGTQMVGITSPKS